jgi:hypothetical protein
MSDGWIAVLAIVCGCMAVVHARLSTVAWRKMKGQKDD